MIWNYLPTSQFAPPAPPHEDRSSRLEALPQPAGFPNPADLHTVTFKQQCETEEAGETIWSTQKFPCHRSAHSTHTGPPIPPFVIRLRHQSIWRTPHVVRCRQSISEFADRTPPHSPGHYQSGTRADVATQSGRIRIAGGRGSNVGINKLPTSLHTRIACLNRTLKRASCFWTKRHVCNFILV